MTNKLLSLGEGTLLANGLCPVLMASALVHRGREQLKLWANGLDSFFALEDGPGKNILRPLFLVSFVALYVEVMLIRWIGTEVRVFAYFQNLALIACFLGFGLGCYRANRKKTQLFDSVAMATLVVFVQTLFIVGKEILETLSLALSLSPDAVMWAFASGLGQRFALWFFFISVVMVCGLLLFVVATMIPLGQWVGFYLEKAPNPISAYSINLLGSLAGIWVFAGMAFLWLPPEYWFGFAFLLLLLCRPPSRRVSVWLLLLLAGTLILLRYARAASGETYWSPYQKLELISYGDQQYEVRVNNTGYMSIASLTPGFLAHYPQFAQLPRERNSYDEPFRFAGKRDRVLIVGAGAGNDAAAALRNGAGQVDAVEIDPVIYSLGERLHPEHPYNSPKVRKILNDARAFMRQTRGEYDVILFGLLDSHTQFSDLSNVRIDNYVYTEEAFREAKRLLKPSGIVIVKFEVRPPWTWIGQRFYLMLERAFGRPPIVFYVPRLGTLLSATVFITSNDADLWSRAAQPELAGLISSHPPQFPLQSDSAPPPTTDDWPYVYHRGRSIPRTYFTVSLLLLGMSALLVRSSLEYRQPSTWHFFFLGGGFLLLETQLVSRLALYFGTTWFVNCVALSAILLMLVVANLYVERFRPRRLGAYYVLLVACLIANYFFPWQRLPFGARAVGILLSAAYSFAIFFAGVIFTETFRRSQRKANAFGANIIGAVAGGLAQNISFIAGMKALLLVAAVLYASAAVCGTLQGREAAA